MLESRFNKVADLKACEIREQLLYRTPQVAASLHSSPWFSSLLVLLLFLMEITSFVFATTITLPYPRQNSGRLVKVVKVSLSWLNLSIVYHFPETWFLLRFANCKLCCEERRICYHPQFNGLEVLSCASFL